MVKLWKYYKYYFCTLWRRPLFWLLIAPMIYVRYEEVWWVQAIIYTSFALLLPFAVACERCRKDYDLDDIQQQLDERESARQHRANARVGEVEEEVEVEVEEEFSEEVSEDSPDNGNSNGGGIAAIL